MKVSKIAISALLATWIAATAQAAVVVDHRSSSINGLVISDASTGQEVADYFSLSTGATVGSVVWRGSYLFNNTAPAADSFSIRFYSLNGGSPSLPSDPAFADLTITNLTRVDTGQDYNNFDVYEYSGEFAATALAADIYAMSIYADTSVLDPNDNWAWVAFSNASPAYARLNRTSGWIESSDDFYFALSTTDRVPVPEPATLSVVGLGLAALVLTRRRRGH